MTKPPSRPKIKNLAAAYVRRAPAEAADQEVHRDQDDLEEHVEQEDVGGQEQEQRAGLHRQHQGEEDAAVVLAAVAAGTVSRRGRPEAARARPLGRSPEQSKSFQLAMITTGVTITTSSTRVRPIPSRPRA